MALSDLRQASITIVNKVQRRLGLQPTAALGTTAHSQMLLELLNQVIDELADAGNWMELYQETTVAATSSVGQYSVNPTGVVRTIYEIHFDTDVSPLRVVDIQEIRRLQQLSGFGRPRSFAIVGVNSANANPIIRIHPIPGSAQNNLNLKIAYIEKPVILTTADSSVQSVFPAILLTQGLYAKALLEENGGESTPQYEIAYAEFERMKREALNRLVYDTGTDIYFVPTGDR